MMTSAAISPNYVDEFPADDQFFLSLSHIKLIIILVVGLSEFLLIRLLTDKKLIYSIFCGFHPTIESQLVSNCEELSKDCGGVMKEREIKRDKRGDVRSVSGGDIDVVFRSLGMFSNGGEAKLAVSLGADDIFELFEEKNPSLEEVKEAFDVFDEDRDGFIDAEELQTVLGALGLTEGLKLENCRKMIAEFDENEDGRIDFDEFVRFMESSLC
ncbi:hypothetical protein C2S51_031231 [Perilla frutescens var. frutescens]|nr:hypothetical protein C2S51_031231 [Perilla frutescens var. frutescens]